MFQLEMILLYVADPAKSSNFYSELLGKSPTTSTANFAQFSLGNGFSLGLYARAKVEPPAEDVGISGELSFTVLDLDALKKTHASWIGKGIRMIQAPKRMYYGASCFIALDPDGHRLRVNTPDEV